MRLHDGTNRYGTPTSYHRCEVCGREYSVTPTARRGGYLERVCMSVDCASYDSDDDADLLFDDQGTEVIVGAGDYRITRTRQIH